MLTAAIKTLRSDDAMILEKYVILVVFGNVKFRSPCVSTILFSSTNEFTARPTPNTVWIYAPKHHITPDRVLVRYDIIAERNKAKTLRLVSLIFFLFFKPSKLENSRLDYCNINIIVEIEWIRTRGS